MLEEYNMGKTIKGHKKTTYWVAISNKGIVSGYGSTEVGNETVSGQDNLEEYKTEKNYLARLKELNIKLEKI